MTENPMSIKNTVEAIVFASGEPIDRLRLIEVLGCSPERLDAIIGELAAADDVPRRPARRVDDDPVGLGEGLAVFASRPVGSAEAPVGLGDLAELVRLPDEQLAGVAQPAVVQGDKDVALGADRAQRP